MTFAVSTEFHDALLVGGALAFLDGGPGNAYIYLYGGVQPEAGAVAFDPPLVTIVLAKPAGALASHLLVLLQGETSGDLILNQGEATWGRLMTASDVWVGDGTVSDAAGTGDFKVSGTTGTLLYAGARAILGLTTLG